MDWVAVGLTLKLAALTTLILGVVGLPLAYWLATTKRAWRPLVDAAVAVPLLLPPTVLGFYLLMATGPNSTIGRIYERMFDGTIPFSFAGILLASVLYNLPFAVRPFASGFAAVDRRLLEAARCLGASGAAHVHDDRAALVVAGGARRAGPRLRAHRRRIRRGADGRRQHPRCHAHDCAGDLRRRAGAGLCGANEASALLLLFAVSVLAVTYSLQRRVLPL